MSDREGSERVSGDDHFLSPIARPSFAPPREKLRDRVVHLGNEHRKPFISPIGNEKLAR